MGGVLVRERDTRVTPASIRDRLRELSPVEARTLVVKTILFGAGAWVFFAVVLPTVDGSGL
jgi:hypothetical protein